MPADARVAVVGGGITGLAAALRLVRRFRGAGRAAEVVLLEAGPRLGGKVQTDRIEGLVLEQGPDSFLAQKPWAGQLCREVGLGDHLVGTGPEGRRAYIAFRGRLEPIPEGLLLGAPTRPAALWSSRLLSPWGKLRASLEPWIPPTADGGDISVGAFFRHRIGAEAAARIAEPLLSGIHAGRAAELSLRATFPQLLELERRYGSLVRGFSRARRGPREGTAFLTVRGGLGRLVEATAAALDGVRILTSSPVQSLRPGPGQTYHLRLPDGGDPAFDAVILALPAHAAAGLVDSLDPDAAAALADIGFASTAVVALAYPRAAVRHPMAGSGFLVPEGEGRAITACTWVSSKWPDNAPPDVALLRCYLGRTGGTDPEDIHDQDLVAAARRDLEALMGLDGAPALARVYRWPRGLPQYTVGHLDRVARAERALAGHPRVALAGASYRGVGLPDCIRQGWEAADRLAAALGVAGAPAPAGPSEPGS